MHRGIRTVGRGHADVGEVGVGAGVASGHAKSMRGGDLVVSGVGA